MNRWFTPGIVFSSIFFVGAALIGYALYLQHAQNLEPCPMCILQRYAFVAIAAVALVGALHNPAALGLKVYSGLIVLFAVLGGGVAIRHSWVQRFPPISQSCGADLEYLLDALPLTRALPAIFRGSGECSEVQWKMLGLSIPEWALVWFVIFTMLALALVIKARSR